MWPSPAPEQELLLARELGLRCLVFLSRAAREDREPELNDFLDTEVTEYHSGVWPRLYEDEPALRREIAARTSRKAFQLLGRTAQVKELDEVIHKLEHPEPSPPPRPSLWERLKSKLAR